MGDAARTAILAGVVGLFTSGIGGYFSSAYGARVTIVRLEERVGALGARVDRQDTTISGLATRSDVDAVRTDLAEIRRLLVGIAGR